MRFIRAYFKRFNREKGNSLTFLLGSASIISMSLAVTTMVIGPMSTKEMSNVSQVAGVKDVAEHHLDRIEKYMNQNPQIFLDNTTWDRAENKSGDGLPAYQRMYKEKFDQLFPVPTTATVASTPSLRRFQETIKANGIPTDVVSEMSWDSTNAKYSILRLNTVYSNTFVIAVDAAAGSKKTSLKRTITVSPKYCALDKAPTPLGLPIPAAPGGAAEDLNFKIGKVSGPFVQVGSQRVCQMPEKGQATPLTCDFQAGGIELIAGNQDSQGTSKTASFVAFLPGSSQLQFYHNHGGTIFKQTATMPTGITAKDIEVQFFRPSASDNSKYFHAAVFFKESVSVKLAWARWNSGGIDGSTGIFTGAGAYTDVFPGITIDSFAYHPFSRMVVGTGKDTTSQPVLAKKNITYPFTADPMTTSPLGTTAVTSTAPAATNQARDLAAATIIFGKPTISKDGSIVVVPVLTGASGISIMAFNTKNITVDDRNRTALMGGGPAETLSNTATLLKYDGTGGANGGLIGSLDNVYIWYNNAVDKFYWLTRGNTLNDGYLYEWDPHTWGIGPTTNAQLWLQSGTSPTQLKRNIKYVGNVASVTSLYMGTYATVRKVGPEVGSPVPLWADATSTPLISYNKNIGEYYMRDGQFIRKINLTRGYVADIGKQLAPPGRNIALDSRTGWLYYTTMATAFPTIGNMGIHGYNPYSNQSTQLYNQGGSVVPVAPGITSPPSFADTMAQGDGNVFYSVNNEMVYYLDIPTATINATTRPLIFPYRPYCIALGKMDNMAGRLPGFTQQSVAWSIDNDNLN